MIGHILAADIGGTSSRFAMFALEESENALVLSLLPESRLRLPTSASASFPDLLRRLYSAPGPGGLPPLPHARKTGAAVVLASLAVPGPVKDGFCYAPNVSFTMSEAEITLALGLPGSLLNDFKAQGLCCLFPEILGLRTQLPGAENPDFPSVVLGAGTGLGKAVILPRYPGRTKTPSASADSPPAPQAIIPLTPDQRARAEPLRLDSRVLPSEGGHSAFPFIGAEEFGFAVSTSSLINVKELIGDLVVTGRGLAALVAYFGKLSDLPSPEEASAMLPRYPQALEWLARFYGRACRDLALETLALGGVFLSGGLLSHVPGLRGHPAFAAEFRQSRTQGQLLGQIPVWWVSNQDSGLWGAALHGVNTLYG